METLGHRENSEITREATLHEASWKRKLSVTRALDLPSRFMSRRFVCLSQAGNGEGQVNLQLNENRRLFRFTKINRFRDNYRV